jgi:hypothetical protein
MSEVKILNHDPLSDADAILRDEYYGQVVPSLPPQPRLTVTPATPAGRRRTKKKTKPDHYRVVCISLYVPDIENLDSMVRELKKRGHTKANKSQLIRYALKQLDLDKLPPPIL